METHTSVCNNKNLLSALMSVNSDVRNSAIMRRAVGYTAVGAPAGIGSLYTTPSCKRSAVANSSHVRIPVGAVIDWIEFNGVGKFSTRQPFSIGLGALNGNITFPLIIDGTTDIANEKIGGNRHFLSVNENGSTTHALVIFTSFVNVCLQAPIESGNLQVVVYYHLKPGYK